MTQNIDNSNIKLDGVNNEFEYNADGLFFNEDQTLNCYRFIQECINPKILKQIYIIIRIRLTKTNAYH